MKKLLLALLLVTMCASSPSAKVLLITSNAANANNENLYLTTIYDRMHKTQGFDYDRVLATDTVAVWTMANSGNYTEAICIGLPLLNSAYNSPLELTDAGWPCLSSYVNRNAAKAFPIRLIIPIPQNLDTLSAGCWGRTVTGQRGWTGVTALESVPVTNADGDSIYVNTHGTFNVRSRVAVTDSLSWVEPMVWQDVAVGTTNQKYCYIWRTVGTGAHEVVYLINAHHSWIQPFLAAVIAMGEPCTPIDMPILMDNYGYVAASLGTSGIGFGTSIDTVSFAYNLHRIVKDEIVPNGMKVDFLVSTYQMDTQNKTNIKALTTLAASYPDNIRMTHKSDYAWGVTSNRDWLGFANAGTYSQMCMRINRSMDSTEANGYDVSSTRMLGGEAGRYAGLNATSAKTDSVLRAIVDCGVSEIYVSTNAWKGADPYKPVFGFGVIGAGKTWIGETYSELKMYPMMGGVAQIGSINTATANGDSARVYYLNRSSPTSSDYQAYRGAAAPSMLKAVIGEYGTFGTSGSSWSYSSSSAGVRKISRSTNYSPGLLLETGMIPGGSRQKLGLKYAALDSTRSMVREELQWINNYVNMANNIVTRYGETGQPVFRYCWPDEVKLDRQLGRPFINSHVRNL